MFRCDKCKEAIGPKVSPIFMVGETRDRTYEVVSYDEETGDKSLSFSPGFEIVKELRVCPPCAGVVSLPQPPLDVTPFVLLGQSFTEHARKCQGKKPIFKDGEKVGERECDYCKRMMETYASMPAPVLTPVLAPTVTKRFTRSMGALLVERLVERAGDESKRAQADYGASYALLKNYEQSGGGI